MKTRGKELIITPASKLKAELSGWLDEVPTTLTVSGGTAVPVPNPLLKAIIAPHAGYSYSGPTAAYAYKCIEPSAIQRVFILGPSHHVYLDGCALSTCDVYATPFGNLILDLEVMAKLKETGQFSELKPQTDEDEHSIEMHLPYLYSMLGSHVSSVKIVPILVGSINPQKEKMYGNLLSPYVEQEGNFFIISSDFCHWGSRFDYNPLPKGSVPIYKFIENLDREGIKSIEMGRPEEFTSYLKSTRNTICGRHPIGVFLNALNALREDRGKEFNISFVKYAQSSEVKNPRESSVSYASAIVLPAASQ
ncbi:Protein memo1 [Phlyctochytrium planicorne]|nr:Protein memo1 [Phlyctochytrium planicorne]